MFRLLITIFCLVNFSIYASDYHPVKFLDKKVDELVKSLEGRKLTKYSVEQELSPKSKRNNWLKELYKIDLVEASYLTKHVGDKLIVWELLVKLMGKEKAYKFHPTTMGLKNLLIKADLLDVDGNIKASKEEVQAAILKEFPRGYIVKPASMFNSQGKFYFKNKKFLKDLVKNNSELYSPKELKTPYFSTGINAVGSGEKYIIQENVILAAGYKKVKKAKEFMEIRVHTLENKVVKSGTFARWAELDKSVKSGDIQKASDFVQKFLDSLPENFLSKMAWGLDVAVLDNGETRLIEINANRGRKNKQWSGYMSRPKILGAYTRHIEKNYNVKFAGIGGFLFRNDMGSMLKYLKKRYIEGIY